MMGPLHILIIDDEEDMCWALQKIVESEGHRCAVAKSARETLPLLAANSFHLAFVDVKLPDMEGLDLVVQMRRLAPRLPCVLVSGYFYEDDQPVQAALKAGLISGFIGKPFLLSQVRESLCGTACSP